MTQERKRRPGGGGADLRRDRQNSYTKPDETATADSPRFLIERVVAFRVRVEPRNALEPYSLGNPEIFTTHTAAAHSAKEYGKGWGFPVVDLSGGEA